MVELLQPVARKSGDPTISTTTPRAIGTEPMLGGKANNVRINADKPAQHARRWRVRCRDVASRDRFLTVLVERGRVVLVGPPGETAVLSAGQLSQLRAVLREAANEAER